MKALALIVIVGLPIGFLIFLFGFGLGLKHDDGKADRAQRRRHEAFLDDLDKLAIENRDVDPFAELAHQRIRTHLTEPTRKTPR